MKRKLLFLAPSAYPLGGLATWLDSLLPALEGRGWEALLGLPDSPHSDASAYLARHPWGRVVRIANRTGSALGRHRALVRVIGRVQPDLVLVVNLAATYPAVQELRARGRFRGKVAMALHGFEPGLLEDLRRFAGVLDGVIVSNALGAAALCEWGYLAGERIFRAGYGVDFPASLPETTAPDTPLEIAWVGRFEEGQKRLADVAAVALALDRSGLEFRLHLAGAGPEEAFLRDELAGLLESGRVVCHGDLPRDRVTNEVMCPGRVLLITSSWETGPIVALEAISRGMAVVTSDFVGRRAEGLLRHEETALVFPVGDVPAGCDALARLADAALRQRLARQAWLEASARCSSTAALSSWCRALEAILDLPELPRPAAPALPPPAGRIDRWLGVRAAELARRLPGLRVRHASPGSEWPHTAGSGEGEGQLLERLGRLEEGGVWNGRQGTSRASERGAS